MAEATEQSRSMVHEATERSRTLVQEATERSNSMIHEATERSQKMVFVAETKAAAAMDTYNTMVNKANSQSKQLKSLLQSQLSLYENFEAEYAVDQMVQPKLNAVKKAEPVLETKAEPVVAGTDDGVASFVEAGKSEPVEKEFAAEEVKPVSEVKPETEAVKEEPVKVNFSEAAEANAAAAAEDKSTFASEDSAAADEIAKSSEENETSAAGNNRYGETRKPLFSRFNPRGSMVFNRNGFPRKNADLRVALSELQKTAETKAKSDDSRPGTVQGEVKPEPQNDSSEPEENKES